MRTTITVATGNEHIEYMLTQVSGNTWTLIGDGKRQLCRAGRSVSMYVDPPAGRREACSVIQNVDQRLFYQCRVDIKQR